jgi:hypothetical protein
LIINVIKNKDEKWLMSTYTIYNCHRIK